MGNISPDALSARADALIAQLEGLHGYGDSLYPSDYPSDSSQARLISDELDMLREYQGMSREARGREDIPRYEAQAVSFQEEAARLQAKVERMMMENEEYEQATSLLDMSQPLDRILAGRMKEAPYVGRYRERTERQATRRHELFGGGPSAERLGLPAPRSPERAARSRAFAESPGLRTQLKGAIAGGYTPRSYGGVEKFGMFRRGAEGAHEPVGEFDPWKRKRPGTTLRRR